MTQSSRIPNFYKMNMGQRLQALRDTGWLSDDDAKQFEAGDMTIPLSSADGMVENVVGVFGLPMGLGLNFLVNNREYVVPFVVEEPSIVAAVSSAAKMARETGGYTVESEESLLIGQVQLVDVKHAQQAKSQILQKKKEIINAANELHPNMVARGGGAKDLEVFIHPDASERGDMVVVHLLVDTCDAMGANLVNTMCEGVAPYLERLTKGRVFLRILSNLADRALVKARCVLPPSLLEGRGFDGDEVRDSIIIANDFARTDPYRAATHNKGIMNGIDSVALATGNDWRAIEAAAHAYAARGAHYTSLTKWFRDDDGNLVGELELPLKVGIVGGNFKTNPAVAWAHRILDLKSAAELAHVMAAVGLAQNFAALRALVTNGIQQGHMTLHARSVALSAGASPDVFETVVERLIASGEVKLWKAEEIVAELAHPMPKDRDEKRCIGQGKVILMGEHAAVYGRHVVAAPVGLGIEAKIHAADCKGVRMLIPRWNVEQSYNLNAEPYQNTLHQSLALVFKALELPGDGLQVEVYPDIPRAMGLGGSAAVAVAIIRAASEFAKLELSDERVNELAYMCEGIVHGSPSGIDNRVSTFGKMMLFKKGNPPRMEYLKCPNKIPIVIGVSGVQSLTATMVSQVAQRWERNTSLYERIFNELDQLALLTKDAVEAGDLRGLGDLMNVGQGLLNGLGVSSRELEDLVDISRRNGAYGAKLTGSGGGGAMIALCPDGADDVVKAMAESGYQAFASEIG